MSKIIPTTVNEVWELTQATLVRNGREAWDARDNAYWKAFLRRHKREKAERGPFGAASECLVTLSSRVIDRICF